MRKRKLAFILTASLLISNLGTLTTVYATDSDLSQGIVNSSLEVTDSYVAPEPFDESAHGTLVESGVCGTNVNWKLYQSGMLYIYGEGDMENYYLPCSASKEDANPLPPWTGYDIKKVYVEQGVTSIGAGAFYGDELNKVEIADSVTFVGEDAFSECSKLTAIQLPPNVDSIGDSAFKGCNGLKNIVLSDNLISIGESAFYGCGSLENIQIPEGTISIGRYAFYECSSLVDIQLSGEINTIGNEAFVECSSLKSIEISGSAVSIGQYAFGDCSSLESVTMHNGVTSIGENAFDNCNNLENIVIPQSLTDIGRRAFDDTIWLENQRAENPLVIINDVLYDGKMTSGDVVLPDTVRIIHYNAFNGCTALTNVQIPNSVTTIEVCAFRDCINLKPVEIPESVTTIESTVFSGCESMTSMVIPNTVTNLGDHVFSDCTNLTSVKLPDHMEKIPFNTFDGCSSLNNIELPEGIKSIEGYAFRNCTSLESIDIPEGVNEIRYGAFEGCSTLTSITIPSQVTELEDWLFRNCTNLEQINFPDIVSGYGIEIFDGTKWLENKRNESPLVVLDGLLYDGKAVSGTAVIPDGVICIAREAFRGNENLTGVQMSDTVQKIEYSAFSHCENLVRVEFSSCINYVSSYAFYKCNNLNEVIVPNGVTGIDDQAFDDTKWLINRRNENPLVIINNLLYDGKAASGDIEIPYGVTEIGKDAFWGNNKLDRVVIPDSVTDIGAGAFEYCYGLYEIEVPASVMNIGEGAFDKDMHHTIYTTAGSVAEAYAKKYDIPVVIIRGKPDVVLGDVNENGDVELEDAKAILQGALGIISYEGKMLNLADIDGSGEITLEDANKALKLALGILSMEEVLAENIAFVVEHYLDITIEMNKEWYVEGEEIHLTACAINNSVVQIPVASSDYHHGDTCFINCNLVNEENQVVFSEDYIEPAEPMEYRGFLEKEETIAAQRTIRIPKDLEDEKGVESNYYIQLTVGYNADKNDLTKISYKTVRFPVEIIAKEDYPIEDYIEISVTTDKDVYHAGETIELKVSLINNGTVSMYMMNGNSYQGPYCFIDCSFIDGNRNVYGTEDYSMKIPPADYPDELEPGEKMFTWRNVKLPEDLEGEIVIADSQASIIIHYMKDADRYSNYSSFHKYVPISVK